MTLILQDADVQGLLPMAECITAMEEAFAEFARGAAASPPRLRYSSPTSDPEFGYFANIIVGALPKYNAAAVRIGSARTRPAFGGPGPRPRQHGNREWGNFFLYSLETAELLAVISDFTIGSIRVGATTAVAVKRLARPEAVALGLFGSGKEARTNLEGVALVRPIRRVKVFSLNPEHRRSFAQEMSARLEIEVTAVDEPREVVRGVDIVCCATNIATSDRAAFDGRWLEPGQLVTSIVNSDSNVKCLKSEVDETTFVRSDSICINDRAIVLHNRQLELLDPIERGLFTWDKVYELGDVVIGTVGGRRRPEDLIYYKNNGGMGIQFAAAGALVYQEALKQGVGQQVPTEWFGADLSAWYEKGYR